MEFKGHELKLDTALKQYDAAKKYVNDGPRKNWDNYYKVYKGVRVLRNYEGISDPNVRESHTIIETLVANIASGIPKFHFVKTNEEQTDDTEILNNMLDYYMLCNQMGLKNQEWVRDMLLYGTGILHVSWIDGKPYIENIPLRDFFVDPTARSMATARYAGYEYLVDKKTLESTTVYSAKEDAYVPKYKNLDKIGFSQNGDDSDFKHMDKKFKDLFNNSTLGDDAVKEQVHVIKMYDLYTGKMVEIGNRKDFIFYDDTPFQRDEEEMKVQVEGPDGRMIDSPKKLDEIDPFLPFAVLRDYVDTSLFYGDGEMAVIMNDAELLNDYEAMDMDNSAYQNTPMYQIDPQFADLAPEIETIPGAVYPIPKGAISPLERPQLTQDLDLKKDRIAERMRRATAADEAVQGASQQQGRITATEVSTQLAQAQNRFSTKISNLESEGYAQLATVIFKMVQIFVSTKAAIRIVGKMGIKFKDYDPWEFNGEWEPHVQLDTTIKQQQLEVGQKNNQLFEYLKSSPTFDPIERDRFIVQHIDPNITDDQFNAMLAKAPSGPSPEEVKTKAEMDKARLSALATMYIDDGTPPEIKMQIEPIMGLQPAESRAGDMQNRMLEQANKGADLLNPTTQADGSVVPGMEGILNPEPATPPQGV